MEAAGSLEYLFLLQPFLHSRRSVSEMERFVAFVLSNFSTIVILSSLAWMILRAYQVLSQPSEDLINLLGIEVPSAPALSLHGIKADGVILNWKAPDLQKSSSIKYCLYINGVNVNELSPQETSIAVTGLRPDTNYIIRVVAVNPLNFEAKSEPIHVQTRCATTQDFFQKRDSRDESAENDTVDQDASLIVRPYKLLGDTGAAAPAMLREHSGSISQQRKSTGGRRVSASAQQGHQNGSTQASDEGEGAVRELTAKLDKLNVEIDATKEDLGKEDEEYQSQQSLLATSKNDLKQAVTDKEGASKALKKQVADLSGQNSAAQGKRATAEKRLHSKYQDHQKLRDDIKKWDREIAAFRADAERLDEEKIAHRKEADEKVAKLREELCNEANTNKAMEDQLKHARSEIRELEHEMDRLGQEETDDVQGPHAFSQSRDTDWPQKLHALQMNYHGAFQKLEQARIYAQQAQISMDEWEQRRAAQPHFFLSPPIIDMQAAPSRRDSDRRSRTMSLRNELSPSSHGFDLSAPPPYTSAMATISPAFASVSPFFNMMNGAPMAHDHMATMSPAEIEHLTGGAPTSPSVAGVLLPSGLLFDDEPSKMEPLDSSSSKSSPMAANALPGLGAPQTLEHAYRDPASPISNTSRSPSVFQSPRESATHLPFTYTTDGMFDSDRRSVRSNTSSFQNLGPAANSTTRFANLFGFNRQRGKTSSDEGPALGSLKSAESQSFPRQDMHDIMSTASRRRGSHSGGTWRDQIQNPFSRNSTNKEPPAEAPPARRRFGFLPPKTGEAPDSPRPGSTASSENTHLPKPSADSSSRFGWGMPSDPFGQRNSPLGADWGLVTNSWSRHPSRRPSIQYGPGHNFMEESYLDQNPDLAPRRRSPKLAPIGTRPTSQISTGSKELPRLNPAAPTFKTLFTRSDKKSDKSEKGEKSEKGKGKKESPKDKNTGTESHDFLEPSWASNPPSSHSTEFSPTEFHYRGAPSISTADTASEPRESLELTPSRTSEATPKETFMQKLSRKSSASMFGSFPGFGGKEKGTRFTTKKVASPSGGRTPDETDEEGPAGSSTKMSSSYVSESGKGGGLSPMIGASKEGKEKFSFRRSLTVGRRKDKDASASSLHESVASETGDEEFEEDCGTPVAVTNA